jgi:hypothetical protein
MNLTYSWQDSLDGGSALSQERHIHRETQTQKKMSRAEFVEQEKIFRALDRKATLINAEISNL